MTSPAVRPSHGSEPATYFEEAYGAAREAERAVGGIERAYTIGGDPVSLRFAGPVLLPLVTPALAHLASPRATRPELTVLVWDGRSTRTGMPPPPWSTAAYSIRGEVAGYNDARFTAVFQSDVGALSLLDRRRAVAIFWVRDPGDFSCAERAAPLLRILHSWMRERGRQVVHAGAVGTPRGGVLLAGRGGSGKSSTALACLRSELLYAADDYCLLAPGEVPTVHSLYNSGKVHARDVRRLPFLEAVVSNQERAADDKALCFLHDRFADRLTRGFPLRAILLPRVTGSDDTLLQAISPGEAVRALAPSTVGQLACAGAEAVRAIASVARRVPSYRLHLGTQVDGIPAVIARLLR